MVWKKVNQIPIPKRSIILKNRQTETIEKSGISRKTNFPEEKEYWRDYGKVDFEDHQLEHKTRRDLKIMRELEELGL